MFARGIRFRIRSSSQVKYISSCRSSGGDFFFTILHVSFLIVIRSQKENGSVNMRITPHSEALLHPSATALLRRYEASWADIAQRNTSVCSRSREIAGDVAKANARAGEASAAWGQFRAELQALPQFALQMRELASSVADACARIDALEHRLHDAALARAEQDEGRWRQGQVELVAAEAEAAELARALEREQIFQAQFEAQREYLRQHGELGTLAFRRPALAQQVDATIAVVAAATAQATLADVAPCAGDVAELDDFYGSGDEVETS